MPRYKIVAMQTSAVYLAHAKVQLGCNVKVSKINSPTSAFLCPFCNTLKYFNILLSSCILFSPNYMRLSITGLGKLCYTCQEGHASAKMRDLRLTGNFRLQADIALN